MDPVPSPTTGRVSPSSAAIARPLLVLLPVITFLIPALFVSLARTPTYTAEARLLVGGNTVEAQAVPGFVEAARTLAETYARLVETAVISRPVEELLGLDPGAAGGHISASSVPESSIIRVKGTATNRDAALAYAEAAATALEEYTEGSSTPEEVLDDFEQAIVDFRAAEREQARLRAEAATSPSEDAQRVLAQAEAATERARLRVDELRERYASRSGGSGTRVQLIGEAVDAGSDRSSSVMLAVGGSLVLGLIAGMALVTTVVNRSVVARREAPTAARP